MKKVKTNKLGRRILSIVLTVALMVGLMPNNVLTARAATTAHDISTGSLEISSDGDYTITGDGNTTSNTITIKSNVTANVILSNVSISSSNTPIDIETGATLNLTLLRENTLTSNTGENAALHVPTGAKLVITDESTGSLNATGGHRSAGIGGNLEENSGDVEIHGGTITAKSPYQSNGGGAGIGGGWGGSNGSVTITGGYVNASSANGGAGIGAGYGWSRNGGKVTITGGTVIANGVGQSYRQGAGIGGGHNNGDGGNVVITGGNVQAIAGDGAEAIGKGNGSGSSGTLKDSAGNDISLIEITLDGVTDKTSVTNIVIDGSTYGCKDVVTIGDKLYLYLPADTMPTSVTAGGNTYICNVDGTFYQEHNWVDATCFSPKYCTQCEITEGIALSHNYVNGVCTLCGIDEQGTFHIKNSAQLVVFAQYVSEGNKNTNAVLEADIDMSDVKDWTPIGQTISFHVSGAEVTDTGYTGTFDGNGHVITGLTVSGISGDTYSYGLFGTVSGTVKHLGMDGFKFTMGSASDARAGAVAGQVLTGGTIENCYSIGHSVTTNSNIAGGIAGCNYGGTIRNCYAYNGSVSGYDTRWGGVVGDCQDDGNADAGTVTDCYTDAERVVSTQNDNTKITNCEVKNASAFASGEVTYKLNGSTSDGDLIWYQTLGTDNTPNFTGDIVMYSEGTYTNHTHEWIYSLGKTDESSDIYDKIVAECTIDGCKTDQREIVFKHVEEEVYLASEEIYGSFELEIISNTIGIEPTITYVALEGELTDGKPSKPGKYKVIASLTDSQDKTVSVEFTFEIIKHSYAGKSGTIFWGLSEDGTLYVNGEGRIPEYLVQDYYDKVQKIVIKDGITSFEEYAFKYSKNDTIYPLPNLKYIEIPGSVEVITYRSFAKCDTLETIVINEGVKTIGADAFRDSNNIQSVNIPDSVVELTNGTSFRGADIKDIETSCRWKDTIVSNGTIGGSNPISGTVTYTHPIEYSCSGDKIIYGCPCGETKYEAALRLSLDEPIYYTGEEIKPAVTITYPEGWGDIKTQPTAENCVYTNNTNAGTATCTFQFAEGIEAKLNYTINKATPIVEAPAVKNEISYGESLSNVGLTEGWSWQDGEQIPDVNNNGCVAVKSLTDDNNYDYSNLDGYSYDATNHTLSYNLAVTVNKAQPTIEMFTFEKPTDLTYTADKKSAVVTSDRNGMGQITIKYYKDGEEVEPIAVGTYKVKIEVAQGDNFLAAEELTSNDWEFTISTMTPIIAWNDQTLASTGEVADITAPTITFAGTDKPEVELTYSYKVQGDAEYTAGLPSDCGTYDVKVNVPELTNYAAVEKIITLTITCTDADNNGICDHCGAYEAPEPVDEYYQIANAGNLMWFAEKVNEGQTTINAKLTADIAMNGIDWTMMSSFAGTFDGNGYTISGLNGHKAYTANTHGFISTLADGGVVKNLTFTEADIWNHEGSGAISAVIVYTNNGTVENCVVKNSLIQHGNYDALGVVVGVNGGTIRNCASISNTMKRRHEGVNNKAACGFVWSNGSDATIENCMVYDCIYTDASANYAFTGINNGTITNCYYYESSETISDTVATAKTADQFASGEVAYLLNGEKTDGTQSWYQSLKTDTYPVPDNKHGTVYYGYVDCQSQDKIYANTELSKDKPEHSWKCELDEANTNKMTFSCTTDGCTKGGTITVTAPEGAIYDGNNHTATVTVETEENEELIETPVITYTSLTEGVELVDGKPVNAGTYKASITLGEVTAYDEFEIAKATPDIGTVSAEDMENTLDISEVVLSRTDDTISGTLSLKEGTELAYGTKDYTYVFKSRDANYNDVEGTVSITISDTIAPTATYQIGTNGFKAFMNAITFGFFFKDTQTVEIQYTDDTTDANGNIITKGSGIKTKQYYIASSVVANDAVGSISWTDYTKSISLDKNGKYFVYTKVVDNAGNTVILNSDGIVIYEDSVVTTDSADYTYKSNKDITFEMDAKGNTFATLKDSEGNEVDAEYYTVTDNSKVTFKAAYLDTLTVASKPYTYKIYMNPQGVETNKTELSCEISINVLAKELTVTGATATGRTYEKGNTSVAITVVALEGVANLDAVSVDVTGLKGTLSGANAGDYTEVTLPELKLSGADKDNYVLTQPSEAVPTNVTISPQATGTAQNVTKKYLFSQENADTINLVSLLPKDCGTVVSYGTPAVDGNVTYKVAPSIEEGLLAYTVADGLAGNTGTITIDAKTQNYTSVPITISVALVDQIPVMQQTEVTLKDESQKLTYGQKLSALELAEVVFKGTDGETVTGTLQWKNGDSIPTVDTKKASWEFVPSASYNDKYATAEGELTISVVPATPVVDTLPTVNAITYHPDTTLADIALSGGKMNGIAGELTGTWAWKDTTICPKAGDNAYVAVFTPEDGTNYKTKEVDITVSVAKATPYIKSAVAAEAVTYGEALKNSALSDGVVQYSETDETVVTGSWSWKEVTTKPVVADSNVTQYDVVFTPTDAENYNKVETKITLTVNKAETTPNMPESTMSALYSQKTVGALELPEGWVWDEADSGKKLTVDVAVEATANYNGADKGNYVTESVTISITRQACDHEESDILYTGEGEKAPTCTADGIGHTECTKCKEPMQTNVTVEASGHTGGTATCKNKAECSVCHEGYGELDKNNHAGETEVKDAKKATCAVDGYTGDTYCKDCGAKIATGTKIAKTTNHTWDNGVVTKEATATEKGEKTYTCSVCKTTKKEEIPALGAPRVGEEIASEDGSATYKVTEAGENGNSVTYEAPTDKNKATVVVPATVTINNITYNVTTISDTAFAGNKKLTSVTIGDNVTGFSDKTFKGCSNLKTVDVGNGVTSIPANAFKNFKNLTTVKMGTGVKTIGKNAFYGCKKLKNLTIGKNVVTIGDKAFYKCTSLTKVTIPSKVKTIGKSTFEGCKALKTITIGKSVTKIGSKAFYGCSKTKTLTIKSSKLTTKKIGSKAFTKTPKSMTVKVPKKKFKAYKSMFIKRGVNKKAKFRKS